MFVCLAVPAVSFADDNPKAQTEMNANPISVTVSESTLKVKNAEGCIIHLFSLTGEEIITQRIDSQTKLIDLANLQRGVYIVKIGKFTRKIYLR